MKPQNCPGGMEKCIIDGSIQFTDNRRRTIEISYCYSII